MLMVWLLFVTCLSGCLFAVFLLFVGRVALMLVGLGGLGLYLLFMFCSVVLMFACLFISDTKRG